MADNEKKFISGSVKSFFNGNKLSCSILLTDLQKCKVNEKGYISIEIVKKKSIDQYGNEYYIAENTYVSENKKNENKEDSKKINKSNKASQEENGEEDIGIEDIPF